MPTLDMPEEDVFGEHQSKGFKAGVSAMLVGNYLTTVGNKFRTTLK